MRGELGNKIKKQRIHLKLSLRKVCDAVLNDNAKPISVSYLNDIEQGHRKSPSGKIIIQIANALKLDRQELLNLVGKLDPVIEDVVNKNAKAGILFRKIAEASKNDNEIFDRLGKELNKEENE